MRRKDVLDLDDFSVGELQEVLETAEAMREVLSRPIKRVPSLRGKTIVNCSTSRPPGRAWRRGSR
jgi:aspartate carbamoyltransferase catalytic subunit